MKNYQEVWTQYMQAWSEPGSQKRLAILKGALSPESTYTDPVTKDTLSGYEAIQAYIEQTQKVIPGVHLEIVLYEEHHDFSLAQWNMCDGNGKVLAPGHSFAKYGTDGKILQTIAFFAFPNQ